jgi:deoxyribodipyrimidine photo-lyase
MMQFEPTRQAGLEKLAAFAPNTGRAYASGRNTDFGPGNPQSVSMLSPYVRRRMITEREVVAATLKHHSPEAAEKFIQEVYWRTYFKGWLEMRPSVWDQYLRARQNGVRDLDKDGALRRDYTAATEGATGIDGFDDWARELVETGWLHNHARMWFASIWIFTLRLPWALGADFFFRHLVDADPGSNTLSWRWVGGLHTKGKTYLARADNIERFTNGRFRPSDLAPFAEPLIEDFETPAPLPPRDAPTRVPDEPYALLLTSDDLSPEDWPGYDANPPALVVNVGQVPQGAEFNDGDIAARFTTDALADAAARLGSEGAESEGADSEGADNAIREPKPEAIKAALDSAGLSTLVIPFATTGPTLDFVNALRGAGMNLHEVKRSWDDQTWPLATAGFFKVKKKIPKLLSQAGLT